MPNWGSGDFQLDTQGQYLHNDDTGNVYATDEDGFLTKLNKSNGTVDWQVQPQSGYTRDVWYYDDSVYVGYNATIYERSAVDGSAIDSYSFTDVESIWTDNNNTFYVADDDQIKEYEKATSSVINSYSIGVFTGVVRGDSTNGYIYAGTNDGDVYQLNQSDLSLRNTNTTDSGSNIRDIAVSSDGLYTLTDAGQFWEMDKFDASTLTEQWQLNPPDESNVIDYDSADDMLYVKTNTGPQIQQYDASSGTKFAELDVTYVDGDITVNSGTTVASIESTSVVEFDDSEFTSLVEQVSATQVSGTATMLSPSLNFINTEQVSATTTMNDAGVTSYNVSATQFTVNASMPPFEVDATPITATSSVNDSTTSLNLTADNVYISSTNNNASTESIEGFVILTDVDGNEYFIRSILHTGVHPQFERGETIELTLSFDDSSIYDDIRHTFGDYLTEDTIIYDMTYDGISAIKQNINPLTKTTSYFFKFEPNASIPALDSWWVVMVGMENTTRMYGAGERLTVELLALEPDTGQTFSEITNKYEV